MRATLSAAVAALSLVLPTLARGEVEVRGAGASFPANLYSAWIERFQLENPDMRVLYDSVGSGEGVRRFLAGDVHFGASDRPMTDEEVEKAPLPVVHVPTTAGMVVIGYNAPGLDVPLRLSRETIGGIFAGQIRTWNDPAILADNPGVDLPDRNIARIVRRDSSGTTFIFTSFLDRASATWREAGYQATTSVDFAEAMTALGNEGVSGRLAITEWSLGYVEFSFAEQLGLQIAVIENRMGEFVVPDRQSGMAALAGAAQKLPADGRLVVADPDDAPGAYPIIGYTWALVNPDMTDTAAREGIRRFLEFGLNEGQAMAAPIGYVALPGPALERARALLATLE